MLLFPKLTISSKKSASIHISGVQRFKNIFTVVKTICSSQSKAHICNINGAVQQQSNSTVNYIYTTTITKSLFVFWLLVYPAWIVDCSLGGDISFPQRVKTILVLELTPFTFSADGKTTDGKFTLVLRSCTLPMCTHYTLPYSIKKLMLFTQLSQTNTVHHLQKIDHMCLLGAPFNLINHFIEIEDFV